MSPPDDPKAPVTSTDKPADPPAGAPTAPVLKGGSVRPTSTGWQIKEPTEDWAGPVPPSKLPFLSDFHYQDNYQAVGSGWADWKVIAGTRRGRMHANAGTHREDAFAFELGKDVAVFAVCDGAGSSKYSRVGSEFTARRTVSDILGAVTKALSSWSAGSVEKAAGLKRIVGDSVQQICADLQTIAADAHAEPRDFRCTLLVVIQLKTMSGEEFWYSQVGDGFIGAETVDAAERWGTSDSGDFSGEVGCFVPDSEAPANAANTLTQKDGAGLVGLVLASDGIEDPFFPVKKNVGVIFRQLREGLNQPLEDFVYRDAPGPVLTETPSTADLAKWLAFEKRGENDDRTILVLYRAKKS
jgi:hypothetical protein